MDKTVFDEFLSYPCTKGVYYKNLTTGEVFSYNENHPFSAASVIKLGIMTELFRRFEEGTLSPDELIEIRDEDRLPICGVATFFHSGCTLTLTDLCWLMITISDNMASNLLIKKLGLENIENTLKTMGFTGTVLRRRFFEDHPEKKHLVNTVTPAEIGSLYEMLYKKELVSEKASETMLDMLASQQCTNKYPLLLSWDIDVWHKTGEDNGITHDCGIIGADEPFILCTFTNDVPHGKSGEVNLIMGKLVKALTDQNRRAAK